MRAALWLIGLFALAVAGAWLADHNQGMVAIFLHPYRIDLSLNLFALGLVLLVAVLLLAQKAVSALLSLPREARRWRLQQKERAAHAALLDAYAQFMAGRYLRARKSAELVLVREDALRNAADHPLAHAAALRAVAHVVAAESAHALQDKALRDQHLQQAEQESQQADATERQALTEGLHLRASRWLLDDRDAQGSLERLAQLPGAVARRTVAMRIQLKAARLAGQTARALDTALLLAKHRAFSPVAAQSLVRSLVMELIARTHDERAFEKLWQGLPAAQRALPEVVAQAATRWLQLGGDPVRARAWLLPVWEAMLAGTTGRSLMDQQKLVQALELSMKDAPSPDARSWLARIEAAQQARPNDVHLQYLAGMVYLRHQLWGKAQHLLSQAAKGLPDAALQRRAWSALAELAEQRQDEVAALQAWKQAARLG
ncbi:heme biosynthesis HemY N-terminal domain-containing protein [Limnohabitans sp.]|jgi:HemY protein|uniref:heme biosynthesis HemY N-terminal domain-containing protein n=1 Tax=Limnohabitans sp. TaxID=1907725 RepID=UPI0035B29619